MRGEYWHRKVNRQPSLNQYSSPTHYRKYGVNARHDQTNRYFEETRCPLGFLGGILWKFMRNKKRLHMADHGWTLNLLQLDIHDIAIRWSGPNEIMIDFCNHAL